MEGRKPIFNVVYRPPVPEKQKAGIKVIGEDHFNTIRSILEAHGCYNHRSVFPDANERDATIVMFYAYPEELNLINRIYKAAIEVRNCPFCGGNVKLTYEHNCGGHGDFYKTAYMQCYVCGARSRGFVYDGYYGETTTELDAIEAWNSRVGGEAHV